MYGVLHLTLQKRMKKNQRAVTMVAARRKNMRVVRGTNLTWGNVDQYPYSVVTMYV